MADAHYENELTQTCRIVRRVKGATNSLGLPSETPTEIAAAEKCLFQQCDEMVEIHRRGKIIRTKDILFLLFTADIEEDDIVEFNSKNYAVVSVDQDTAGQGHHKEAMLNSLENE